MKRPAIPTPAAEWNERSVDVARLLGRTGLGDRAAFATLYQRTSPHLFAVVLRIQRDRAQAEDILQEVYVNVWRAAKGFDAAQSQPLTWLTSIARNRAIDSLRRNQSPSSIGPSPTSRSIASLLYWRSRTSGNVPPRSRSSAGTV
jgi:RNA polymerase sigma-70 factor (ECF subfamily)